MKKRPCLLALSDQHASGPSNIRCKLGRLRCERYGGSGPGSHYGRHQLTGEAGVEFLEGWAIFPAEQRRMRIPTITDPRGIDFDAYRRLKQTESMANIEGRLIRAFESLLVLMTNTCINYQTILPPVRGEHLAFGDTGVVIYSNSVMGARSNFRSAALRPWPLVLPAAHRVMVITSRSGGLAPVILTFQQHSRV